MEHQAGKARVRNSRLTNKCADRWLRRLWQPCLMLKLHWQRPKRLATRLQPVMTQQPRSGTVRGFRPRFHHAIVNLPVAPWLAVESTPYDGDPTWRYNAIQKNIDCIRSLVWTSDNTISSQNVMPTFGLSAIIGHVACSLPLGPIYPPCLH